MTVSRADERRSQRNNVLLKATIEFAGARIPVRVVNLSRHGVLASGTHLPREGEEVVFRYKSFAIPSWIAWVRSGCAGVQFAEAVELEIGGDDSFRPITVTRDTRVLDYRRPGLKGDQLTPEERAIVEEWVASGRA
jgi:hypothetical protein